ncbi:MAG: hypothetical protein NZ553_17085 [Caldilinea sp.]|nr:hypothetical protein [Caldilinea sp.]MDW8442196.1 hypothetical protein [Caldilineaceae bacterium]
MAVFQFFDRAIGRLMDGTIQIGTHQFWAYLTNNAPDRFNHQYRSDLPGLSTGNGYVAGGQQLTGLTFQMLPGSPQGIWRFDSNNFSWTASGGNIGPFRWTVIYAKGAGSPNDYLVCYADYGASITVTSGNSFTVLTPTGIFDVRQVA